jgi:hypothetical protein
MPPSQSIPASRARPRYSRTFAFGVAGLLLLSSTAAPAGIFHCVNADGTSTYSDHVCDSAKEGNTPPPGIHPTGDRSDTRPPIAISTREKRAARILDLLRIAPAEPESLILQRTVEDAAPDLVKALDPDNGKWTPANARWHAVPEFVKADLRLDVQSALRVLTAQVARVTAHEYAMRASDSDMDAISTFLTTPDGTRYVELQNEIRPLLYSALDSLQAQEPMPEDTPSEVALHRRKQLLSMALEARVVKDGDGPSTSELRTGSATVLENAARREGATVDELYAEYEAFLGPLQTFTDSTTAKNFFIAIEPALRTEMALSSTATTDFAEQEFGRYVQRWRAVYGPPLRVTTRTTISIRGRIVSIAHTTQTTLTVAGSPEGMAIQCEQRESNAYQQLHRNARDPYAQVGDLMGIRNRCRAEQHLPPI